MLVRIAVLADYASISMDAKLSINGIFSVVVAPQVPCVQPQMQLVCQFEFDPEEVGSKDLKIVLRDADAQQLFAFEGTANVARDPSGNSSIFNQILCLTAVRFERYGDYEFLVLINGDAKASIPLRVVRPSAPPPAPMLPNLGN